MITSLTYISPSEYYVLATVNHLIFMASIFGDFKADIISLSWYYRLAMFYVMKLPG